MNNYPRPLGRGQGEGDNIISKLHGVNIGGWLVLEKWMTPKLFDGTYAEDEYSFSYQEHALEKLEKHWQTFITKEDFKWIKDYGLNAVRIPVGYWNFENDEPFHSSIIYFEKALEWAKEFDLKVIIDLHTAPGSQNGSDNSGRIGEINWHKSEENIAQTLRVLEIIAKKYGHHTQVIGIELLNEPHWDVPLSRLRDFYKQGYEIIRANAPENVAVIMHDGFRPNDWKQFFTSNDFKNVFLDIHLYQCFGEWDIKLNMEGHMNKTKVEWQSLVEELQEYVPVIVGEWSVGLDPLSLLGLTEQEIIEAKESYTDAQVEVFAGAGGWFFWNYKVENEMMKRDWSFKDINIPI